MALGLKLVTKGCKFKLLAVTLGERCPLQQYLNDLERNNEKAYGSVMSTLQRAADHGPPRNTDISKPLGDGLFEFKVGKQRVFFFYEPGCIIICTSGHVKKTQKTPKEVLSEAHKLKGYYESARNDGVKFSVREEKE